MLHYIIVYTYFYMERDSIVEISFFVLATNINDCMAAVLRVLKKKNIKTSFFSPIDY